MNILTDNLPTEVAGYELYTDYKRWILYEQVLKDQDLTWQEKLTEMLMLTIKAAETIRPADIEDVLNGLMWFHSGGRERDDAESSGSGSYIEAYDYDIDQAYILAGFRQAYGIDLSSASMHWWVFLALMQGLPEDTLFSKIVGYRTCDTSNMPKDTARQYNRLKAKYMIKRKKAPKTAEEANAEMRAKLERAYKKAKEKQNNQAG